MDENTEPKSNTKWIVGIIFFVLFLAVSFFLISNNIKSNEQDKQMDSILNNTQEIQEIINQPVTNYSAEEWARIVAEVNNRTRYIYANATIAKRSHGGGRGGGGSSPTPGY